MTNDNFPKVDDVYDAFRSSFPLLIKELEQCIYKYDAKMAPPYSRARWEYVPALDYACRSLRGIIIVVRDELKKLD